MRVLFVANDHIWPLMTGLAQRLHHLSTGLATRHDVILLVMDPSGYGDSFPNADVFESVHTVGYSSCRFAIDVAAGRADGLRHRVVHAVRHRTPAFVERFESPLFKATVSAIMSEAAMGRRATCGSNPMM